MSVTVDYLIEHDTDIPMRDGIRLRADVYRFADTMARPVILFRTPYDKTTISLDSLKPLQCLAADYACVVQDTRGRFASEGDWGGIAWDVEGADTYDTVEWIAAQAWCDGNVGMAGPSYLGITQWLGAMQRPPHLKAIAPTMSTSSTFDVHDTGGAFRLDHILSWLAFMAADWLQRRLAAGDPPPPDTMQKIVAMASNPSIVMDELPIVTNAWFDLEGFPLTLREVLDGSIAATPAFDYDAVSVPTLSVGGFFDVFARATLMQYDAVRSKADPALHDEHRLILGPWVHAGILPPYQGGVNFGMSAAGVYARLPDKHLQFFDRHLRGRGDPLPTIEYFVAGEATWRTAETWPPGDTTDRLLHLHSQGQAATSGGHLLASPPLADQPPDTYVADPDQPVPTCGGRVLYLGGLAPGPIDQSHLATRRDVLTYAGPVVDDPLIVVGNPHVTLYASTSARDCDWVVKLLDIHPDGRAILMADGNLRARHRLGFDTEQLVEPDSVLEYRIDLGPVAWKIPSGHRIGLHIQSSNYPHLDRNLQTGGPVGHEADGVCSTQRIFHDPTRPSHLALPMIL